MSNQVSGSFMDFTQEVLAQSQKKQIQASQRVKLKEHLTGQLRS